MFCSQENLDPPPPRDISKQNRGIWIGWTEKSDRQIIREAASKGHVPLATKFLSLQQNVDVDRITELIRNEVFFLSFVEIINNFVFTSNSKFRL